MRRVLKLMENIKVSVIVPAYNTEPYIENCIESIENQSYKNFEIIVINDGSTDNTLYKINNFISKYKNIKLINIDNHGQGYARNLALKESSGKYVLFLDSDDFIDDTTLELCVNKIENDNSDLVVFDWKQYDYSKEKYIYNNSNIFYKYNSLEGENCLELFKIKHYFTVNKLYRKSFLISNKIEYGEGYIYEDNPFWVKVVVNAKKVSIIHSPLYNVGIATKSTTRNNIETKKHYDGFITACREIAKELKKNPERDYSSLYAYLMKKFVLYYRKRVPKKYHNSFIKDFASTMGEMPKLWNYDINSTMIKISYKYGLFLEKNHWKFYLFFKLMRFKRRTFTGFRILKKKIKFVINGIKYKMAYKLDNPRSYAKVIFNRYQNKALEPKILFMGFDNKYTGNSRYLFEELKTAGFSNIKFVSQINPDLDENYRVEPNSKIMYEEFYTSKVVILESWVPAKYMKKERQKWIQLWHGTPLKKMLFDSNEYEIMSVNKRHKIQKFYDISRWDYLLVDNPKINKYFHTSFLFHTKQMINFGYPRVKYLLDNKNNIHLKNEVKKRLNINDDKKNILYLPTWRDYNYGKEDDQFDRNYILDVKKLNDILGDNYRIIEKNHFYLKGNDSNVIHNVSLETQELLLICDYLITDYSSVMFDGFAIDIPVLMYVNDFDKYQKSRGIYDDIWNDIKKYSTDNIEDLANMIKDYDFAGYNNIKEKYSYINTNNESLCDFIENITSYRVI